MVLLPVPVPLTLFFYSGCSVLFERQQPLGYFRGDVPGERAITLTIHSDSVNYCTNIVGTGTYIMVEL